MIALYIFIGILGAFVLFYLFPTLLISNVIYTILLIRTSKAKWGRTCNWDDDEQIKMFDLGKEWGEQNEEFRQSVGIKSGKFNLKGEYFDFGNDKAVIIIPGRMESGTYSYYFAEPYKKAGYNVLAIDNRSHGLSDGRFNTLGLKEYKDVLLWGEFLHENYGVKKIMIHGICIGSATAVYALTDEKCPDYMCGLVADGMYTDFGEIFKNHLKERKKPLFPFTRQVMGMASLIAGKSVVKNGPLKYIGKLEKPVLFIYTKQDIYALPTESQKLYDAKVGPKKLVWFDKGIHSHIRINNLEKYDQTIIDFLGEL